MDRRFGKQTPIVAAAIAQADAATLFRDISATGEAVVVVDGSDVVIQSDELVISERPQEGWSVVNAHGETVALDLELDDDLRRAGIARELVRAIQDARKRSGLEISDRIRVEIKRTALVLDALAIHATDIATEVQQLCQAKAEVGPGAAGGQGQAIDVHRLGQSTFVLQFTRNLDQLGRRRQFSVALV